MCAPTCSRSDEEMGEFRGDSLNINHAALPPNGSQGQFICGSQP